MSIRDAVNREIARDDVRRKALGDTAQTPQSLFNVDNVMRYEAGEMDIPEVVQFFQDGIDTGTVWNLQGNYGRTARALITAGYCHE